MKNKAVFFLVALLLLLPVSVSQAYEAIPFRNGGSVQGTVEFAGPRVPKDPMLDITTEKEYCGENKPAGQYLIRDRKVRNVVVFLSGITTGKPVPREGFLLTSRKCELIPHVAVAFKGNAITVKNDDPILDTFDVHDVRTGKEVLHVTLHEKGASVTKKLLNAGLLGVSCYVHPWEKAYLYVFDHPYAAVTDENGRFEIADIPPGTYTLEAWHEALGSVKIAEVKVISGRSSTVKVEYR